MQRINGCFSKRCSYARIWLLATLLPCLPVVISLNADPVDGLRILEELREFKVNGTLLFIAAHPDDENTQLITYSAKGRRYRTAYLSITRGDGGQNAIGPEFDASLGLVRTQELLAARRLDGGRQFFTRAIDFGYSKSSDETLRIWDKEKVLGDVVRVIRMFRPDVVVTRFSPRDGNTHGHHTASAILAAEAFRLSGDPSAYPEQLKSLQPWKPVRLLQNGRPGAQGGDAIRIRVDGQDPVTGEDFAAIAGRSRAMHKSQGFDNFGGRFGRGGEAYETFTVLEGEPATEDIFDGIDTGWTRIRGGDPIGQLTDVAIESFDPENPDRIVPALLDIRQKVAALPGDPLVREKLRDLDRIILRCLGITVKTVLNKNLLVPGEEFKLHHIATVQSDIVPVRWLRVRYPVPGFEDLVLSSELMRPYRHTTPEISHRLPDMQPLSQPYWLRSPSEDGIYQVEDPELIGLAEDPPAITVEFEFEVNGQMIRAQDVPVGTSMAGEPESAIQVIAPVRLEWDSDIALFAPGATRRVEVVAAASRPGTEGMLRLEAPVGWSMTPAAQRFRFEKANEEARFAFEVTAPDRASKASIMAVAQVGERSYSSGLVEIRYSHIPLQLLQPESRLEAISLSLNRRGERVAYIPGAGDSIARNLSEMGYKVTPIDPSEISPGKLANFDAVVLGIRAFETEDDLKGKVPDLFAYAQSGGTVVVQYNRENGLDAAPLPLQISRERVTDEDAPVTFLVPDHPVLNTPNRIAAEDFKDWVQERSIYVPDRWDDAYVPVIASNDPGERPLSGQLLVAKYGRGYFVYTSLVFFRELPAGVPGAYRLFANIISLGKE